MASKKAEASGSKALETPATKVQETSIDDPKPFVTPPLSSSSHTKEPSPHTKPKAPSASPKAKSSESKNPTPQNSPPKAQNPNLISDIDVVRDLNLDISLLDPEPLAMILLGEQSNSINPEDPGDLKSILDTLKKSGVIVNL